MRIPVLVPSWSTGTMGVRALKLVFFITAGVWAIYFTLMLIVWYQPLRMVVPAIFGAAILVPSYLVAFCERRPKPSAPVLQEGAR
jgi:hypothetical protein